MIEITKDEAEALQEFIELYLLETIRNDSDIDNIEWIKHIVDIWGKCKVGGMNE